MKSKKSIPYDKEYVSKKKKAYIVTNKTVKPVAKDTNKTRRKIVNPTKR